MYRIKNMNTHCNETKTKLFNKNDDGPQIKLF